VQKKGKTLIVGLGEVGGALAEVLERTGPVLKHDLEPRIFSDPVEVMHLCVPFTRQDRFEEIALAYIERFKPALTIVNSTVIPGTTRAIARRSGRPIAYSPVRGKHVRMVLDLLRYKKFVAACDPDTARRTEEHFRQAAIKTECMDQPETLELAKLAETTYFGVLIAFAQDLNRYAAEAGADYEQAVRFFEEVDFLPRTRYYPGFIGGHCVIPNINLLRQIVDSPLLEAVLDSNRRRAEEVRFDRQPQQAAGGRP
jgi:UDP-N-acetyl-D-mannosaminuronate dehydrogenase